MIWYNLYSGRYGVKKIPTWKFFSKENKEGEVFEGEKEIDDVVEYINEKCGTSRDSEGQLTSKVKLALSSFLVNDCSFLPFKI